jgi:hypothetical protein
MERPLEESYRWAVDGVEEPAVQGGKVVSVRDPDTGEERPFSMTRYSDRSAPRRRQVRRARAHARGVAQDEPDRAPDADRPAHEVQLRERWIG